MAIIVIIIVSAVTGFLLNAMYENKYATPAINWAMFAIQCVFLIFDFFTWPNPDVTGWFVLWMICTVISFILALLVCRSQAVETGANNADIIKAMIAQMILPFGVALVIFIAIAYIMGAFSKEKK